MVSDIYGELIGSRVEEEYLLAVDEARASVAAASIALGEANPELTKVTSAGGLLAFWENLWGSLFTK